MIVSAERLDFYMDVSGRMRMDFQSQHLCEIILFSRKSMFTLYHPCLHIRNAAYDLKLTASIVLLNEYVFS